MILDLNQFEFSKKFKRLTAPSELFGGVFPFEINIRSQHTGKVIKFVPMPSTHPKFDQDQWDGEQACYVPLEKCNVDYLCIHHCW